MPPVRELPRFSQPGHCIMLPGRRRDERGFFLFDTVIDGPNGDIHVGISGEGLRIIAERHGKQFGIVKAEHLERVERERDAFQGQIKELEQERDELKRFKDSISGVTAEGFIVRRREGRPPHRSASKRDGD